MLYELYTSDTIFDKFEVATSYDGRSIATGSYSNQLKLITTASSTSNLSSFSSAGLLTTNHSSSPRSAAAAAAHQHLHNITVRSIDLPQTIDSAHISNNSNNNNDNNNNNNNNSNNSNSESQTGASSSFTSTLAENQNISEMNRGMERIHIRDVRNTQLQQSQLQSQQQRSMHYQPEVRLDEKVLHCSWHPNNNTIAVAGKVGLCLYKV
jgi:hypothetical protein